MNVLTLKELLKSFLFIYLIHPNIENRFFCLSININYIYIKYTTIKKKHIKKLSKKNSKALYVCVSMPRCQKNTVKTVFLSDHVEIIQNRRIRLKHIFIFLERNLILESSFFSVFDVKKTPCNYNRKTNFKLI